MLLRRQDSVAVETILVLSGDLGEWRSRVASSPFRAAVAFDGEDLVLGAGTVLRKLGAAPSRIISLRPDAAHDRMVALLAVAGRGRIAKAALAQIAAALDDWRRGDRGLAAIRLVVTPLPRLRERDEAYSLFLAETALDVGLSPNGLLEALGYSACMPLLKFDPSGDENEYMMSLRINPENPTPKYSTATSNVTSQAYFLPSDTETGWISFDDCKQGTTPTPIPGLKPGDLVEYKTAGWGWVLFEDWSAGYAQFSKQVENQNAAVVTEGLGRQIYYCLGNQKNADKANEIFDSRYKNNHFLACN